VGNHTPRTGTGSMVSLFPGPVRRDACGLATVAKVFVGRDVDPRALANRGRPLA
jgi:hypothetical protein